MGFLRKFQGYNDKVTLSFSQSFNGEAMEVGNLKFKVIEGSISKVTGLSPMGDLFFKVCHFDVTECTKFLKPTYRH